MKIIRKKFWQNYTLAILDFCQLFEMKYKKNKKLKLLFNNKIDVIKIL